jgi:hypothetical protein
MRPFRRHHVEACPAALSSSARISSTQSSGFATSCDELPRLIASRDDYRVLISRGRLVYAFVVEGQLAEDGTIELVSIELDITGPDGERDG